MVYRRRPKVKHSLLLEINCVMTYHPEGLAFEIFKKRYAIHENESWEEACERVANHVAMAEHGEAVVEWKSVFSQVMKENLFMPGGRILYGSGRAKGQLLNCFVVPTSDSREGWGKTVSDVIVVSGTGGGIGINCSPIRPRGSRVNGTGGIATGAVSLMEIINAAGDVIKAGGGRRTALMLCLEINHGDIEEFLDKKLDLDQLNNANVSVVFDFDPEIFFELVRKDEDLHLTFRSQVVKKVRAKKLWYKIVNNALKNGEPGLLNMWYANRMSNIHYWKKLISTNPCGEIALPEFSCCCLGALVLPRFVRDDKFDWSLLRETVSIGVRFLDDVLTVNNYPLPEIAEMCKNERRIGLGVMGLHDMLITLGMQYNSAEGLEFVDRVLKTIKQFTYEASVNIAKEKGPFPKFDKSGFMKSRFVKTLKPTLRHKIEEHGIRNCALLTIAPTGTTSMVCDVTSGIEPMFAPAYERKFYDGDELKKEIVIHPLVRKFMAEGRDVSHFQGSHELSLRDHFEMQRTCQKHVDNAISKTLNVPQGTSVKELSELYMEYLPELKGVTVYPDGSREDQPLTPIPLDDALEQSGTERATSADACRSGVCDI